MIKTALKIEKKNMFEVDPKNRQILHGKRESKASSERKLQGFCDIFNGI